MQQKHTVNESRKQVIAQWHTKLIFYIDLLKGEMFGWTFGMNNMYVCVCVVVSVVFVLDVVCIVCV